MRRLPVHCTNRRAFIVRRQQQPRAADPPDDGEGDFVPSVDGLPLFVFGAADIQVAKWLNDAKSLDSSSTDKYTCLVWGHGGEFNSTPGSRAILTASSGPSELRLTCWTYSRRGGMSSARPEFSWFEKSSKIRMTFFKADRDRKRAIASFTLGVHRTTTAGRPSRFRHRRVWCSLCSFCRMEPSTTGTGDL